MYKKEEVERLAGEYVETGDEQVFEALIKTLIPLINVQLGKNYSSLKEFWDDLRQEVLLKIWKNRGGLFDTKSRSFYQYYYRRVRTWLFRESMKIKKGYDALNLRAFSLDDLTLEEKESLGIDSIEEENYE